MWMYIWFGLAMLEAVAVLCLAVMVLRARARRSALSEQYRDAAALHDQLFKEFDCLHERWGDEQILVNKAHIALNKIAKQETPKANATVKRMARIAREALS